MKIITKILDNYYTEKVKEIIASEILVNGHILDFKIEDGKKYGNSLFRVYIKEPHYEDSEYVIIHSQLKSSSIYYLIQEERIRKKISGALKGYIKEHCV